MFLEEEKLPRWKPLLIWKWRTMIPRERWEIPSSSWPFRCAGWSSSVPLLLPLPHQQNANESIHFTDEKTEAQRGNRTFPKLPDFKVLRLAGEKGSHKQANSFFKSVFFKYLVKAHLEVMLSVAQIRMKKGDSGDHLSLSFALAIPF